MRSLFTKFLGIMMLSGFIVFNTSQAQTVQVTFKVDMSEVDEISQLGVHVAGNFQGWDPGSTELNRLAFGNVFTHTAELNIGEEIQYKFINGNAWGQNESVPAACGVDDGNGGYNRFYTVADKDTILDVVCFGSCIKCNPPQVDITFQVDMSNQNVSPNGVHVAGTFQNPAWQPGDTEMLPIGDDIYAVTVPIGEGEYFEYKFINGNAWGGDETVPPDCAANNNRYYTATISEPLPAVCFGSCDPCGGPVVDVEVTFIVDMSQQDISPDGVHIAGGFQGWAPGATLMSNPVEDIYTYTAILQSGTYQEYKFVNGDEWIEAEVVPAECESNTNNNRYFIVPQNDTIFDTVCYAMCGPCPAPAEVEVTFQVDMSEQTVSGDGVHLIGSFNNYDPTATPMTLQRNGIYEAAIVLTEYDEHTYKFVNGNTLDGQEIVPPACADGDGYRVYNVPGEDQTIDNVCFASCDPCVPPPTVDVDFYVDMSNEIISDSGVYLTGSFNGFDPGATQMTDMGENVYMATVNLEVGTHVTYKFLNGNSFDGEESVPETCGEDNGFGGYNRFLDVTDPANILETVCFSSCSACVLPVEVEVTFLVDMQNEQVSQEGVFIAGSFQGWNTTSSPMTILEDQVYSFTTTLIAGDFHEYKFLNGNTVADYELVPAECASNGGNRYITVPEADSTMMLVCFGTCSECIPPEPVVITFQVDMSNEEVPQGSVIEVFVDAPISLYFEMSANELKNGIYSYTNSTHFYEGDIIGYIYLNDGVQEVVPEPCSSTNGWREFTIPSDTTLIPVVCFGECDPCVPPPTVDVDFYVDMSNEIVSDSGVFLTGSFNGFDPGANQMSDMGENVYMATVNLEVGTHVTYKFLNGNSFDGEESVPEACGEWDGFIGFNRFFDVTDPANMLDVVCFGRCTECFDPVNVTFYVDMSNEMVSDSGVHIVGAFQGWNPSLSPMTDEGNGLYSHATTMLPNTYQEYKFINGNSWDGAENDLPPACSNDDNRYFTVPESDTTFEAVCFGLCGPCPPPVDVEVTFQVDMSNEVVSAEGVYLAGSFNEFNPSALMLTDVGGGIYETTLTLSAGAHHTYKYLNGPGFENQETVPAECGEDDGFGGFNRYVDVPEVDDEIPLHCFSLCDVCEALTHEITLFEGWNSLSSYLMPASTDINDVMDPIANELVILQTMTDVLFPEGGLNTIQTWGSQSAYKIKMTADVTLTISGTPEQNKTLQLAEGWNLIPVISDTPVDVEALLSDVINQIIVVKGIAETGILWPEYNINTIGTFNPGDAYYIKVSEDVEITFP